MIRIEGDAAATELRPFTRPFIRKNAFVTARKAIDPSEIPNSLGPFKVGAGDWIVTVDGDSNDQWPVEEKIFDRVYWLSGHGQEHAAYKVPWTSLLQIDESFEVMTIDGTVQVGQPGDFLAIGVAGELWIVPARTVSRQYVEVADPAPEKIKLFVSYSHGEVGEKGATFIETLQTELQQPAIEDTITAFVDRTSIDTGVAWNEEITKGLAVADVILIIVSGAWISKPKGYARRFELPLAFHARAERDAEIFPILVESSGIKGLEKASGGTLLDGTRQEVVMLNPKQFQDVAPDDLADRVGDLLTEIAKSFGRHHERRRRRSDVRRLQAVLDGLRPDAVDIEATSVVHETGESARRSVPATVWRRAIAPAHWTALEANDGPAIVYADGGSLAFEGLTMNATLSWSKSPASGDGPLDSVVSADDGSIVGAHSGTEFLVAETRPTPTWWSTAVQLRPGERVRAIRRTGRCFTVLLSTPEAHRIARFDSSAILFSTSSTQPVPVAAATASGLNFLAADAGRIVLGHFAIDRVPFEMTGYLDVSSCCVEGHDRHAVVALVQTIGGRAIYLRQHNNVRRWLPLQSDATRVTILHSLNGLQVDVQIEDSIRAWQGDDLWTIDPT